MDAGLVESSAEAHALGRFFEEARALHVDTLRAFATGTFSERLARCASLTAEQFLSSYIKEERLRRVLFAQGMYFMRPPEEVSALVWAVFWASGSFGRTGSAYRRDGSPVKGEGGAEEGRGRESRGEPRGLKGC